MINVNSGLAVMDAAKLIDDKLKQLLKEHPEMTNELESLSATIANFVGIALTPPPAAPPLRKISRAMRCRTEMNNLSYEMAFVGAD